MVQGEKKELTDDGCGKKRLTVKIGPELPSREGGIRNGGMETTERKGHKKKKTTH